MMIGGKDRIRVEIGGGEGGGVESRRDGSRRG